MEEERDKAEEVKQHAPILVILGNPPYNGFAGAAIDEERDLVTAYRTVKRVAAPQGQGLNDLYVRFFRMAERRITEGSEGKGIVCFISNYSWLDGLSFTGMRERYLEVFDKIWIDCLNGDKYKTGKLTPEGSPTRACSPPRRTARASGLAQRYALLARRAERERPATVAYRTSGARTSSQSLRRSLRARTGCPWQMMRSLPVDRAPVRARRVADYFKLAAPHRALAGRFPGVKTSRDWTSLSTSTRTGWIGALDATSMSVSDDGCRDSMLAPSQWLGQFDALGRAKAPSGSRP